MQEFHYAHPSTKTMLNNVFNTHFYGAPLWDLFSSSFERLEKTWNTSYRLMLSLPPETHKYMIEPLSKRQHIICSLRKHFLKFVACVAQSDKVSYKTFSTSLIVFFSSFFLCIYSQVRNIPERIILISTTGLR